MPHSADSPPGDGDAFAALYRDLAPALHAWACLRIQPRLRAYCEADDVLQEVWCRAVAIKERHPRDLAAFRPWLFRIAKNVLLEVARKAQRVAHEQPPAGATTKLFVHDPIDQVTSITRRLARDESLRAVAARIAALPDDERDLVLHVGFEGMSCPEVSARLGLPAETVKKRWQRLRARLETAGLPRLLLEA